MRISLVVAASINNVIGSNGELPWHLPDDLRQFKRLTTGKPVIMGRRTLESIGRPLPNRRNIVMTRNPDYVAPGCEVVSSVDAALDLVAAADEVMIIGGGQVYRDFLPRAERIYLTRVQTEVQGDTHFPELDGDVWQRQSCERHPADAEHRYAFDVMVYERRPA